MLKRSPEQKFKKNTTISSDKYVGVYLIATGGGKYTSWRAYVHGAPHGVIYCGQHPSEKAAAIARDLTILKHKINKPCQVLKPKLK